MWEGVVATGLGKAWESVGKLFSRKKGELEAENLRAAASKLVAETVQLESGTEFQRKQLELADRQALHDRIIWFCDPFRAESARALQEFAKQTSHAFVRLVMFVQANLEPSPAISNVVDQIMGSLLDSFADALPYMHGNERSHFGDFFDSVVVCARIVKHQDTVTPRDDAVMQLQRMHDALLPEVQRLVSPIHIYGAIKEAAHPPQGDAASR